MVNIISCKSKSFIHAIKKVRISAPNHFLAWKNQFANFYRVPTNPVKQSFLLVANIKIFLNICKHYDANIIKKVIFCNIFYLKVKHNI